MLKSLRYFSLINKIGGLLFIPLYSACIPINLVPRQNYLSLGRREGHGNEISVSCG